MTGCPTNLPQIVNHVHVQYFVHIFQDDQNSEMGSMDLHGCWSTCKVNIVTFH